MEKFYEHELTYKIKDMWYVPKVKANRYSG